MGPIDLSALAWPHVDSTREAINRGNVVLDLKCAALKVTPVH